MPSIGDVNRTIVLDNGSGMIRAGLASDRSPRELATKSTDLATVWGQTFAKLLRVAPEEHSILLLDEPLNPKAKREQMAQILFEKFRVPRLHLAPAPVMALRASGRRTGIVLDMGDGVSHIVPIHNGKCLPPTLRIPLSGHHITKYLHTLLRKRGYSLKTTGDRQVARDFQAKQAYVALDYDEELREAEETREIEQAWPLPEGQVIQIDSERFRAPEALFKPHMIGLEQEGIHKLTFQTISKCDADIRKDLYSNIVLSGETTMFKGIDDRLTKELTQLAPESMTIKIIAPPERKYAAWRGAAELASLSTFEEMWITRDEYQKLGPSVLHRKCT